MSEILSACLTAFPPISLQEMKAVKLMDRVDTKYLTTLQKLPDILRKMQQDYAIQTQDGQRTAAYRTLYFDTEELTMYHRHHAGKKRRQKIRTRTYLQSGDNFCEIKNKNNKGKTHKKRIPIDGRYFGHPTDDAEILQFLQKYAQYPPESLLPQLETRFQRMTFVNHGHTERITFDLQLHFYNHQTQKEYDETGLVIMELKQSGHATSLFSRLMRELRIPPYRISKYCIGTIRTNPAARYNRFKEKIRYIGALASK